MKKLFSLIILAMTLSFASFAIGAISGPVTICAGNYVALTDPTPGGTWSSADPGVASINASTGVAAALSAGSTTITYTIGSSYVTAPFTVNAAPAAISETSTSFCAGGTASCTDATAGGTWSTGPGLSITSGGVVTGITPGVSTVYYSVGGCSAAITNTVTTTFAGSISGLTTICLGSAGTLTETGSAGGTWSSSNTAVATVNSAGVVTGISLGDATIRYAVATGCAAGHDSVGITVSNTTSAGTIYGGGGIYTGYSITLADGGAAAPGTWSSSNTAIATVDPTTGTVGGISAGTATITFSVDGCSGPGYTTTTITVVDFGTSSIAGPASGCTGSSYTFSDSGYVGVWSSSDPSVATIDPSAGTLAALSAGVTTITYTYGSSYITTPFVVSAAPAPISESSTSFCVGSSEICTDAVAGGTWSSDDIYVASVSASGIVSALSGGSTGIYYTLPGGCYSYINNTVNVTYSGVLSPLSLLCVGSSAAVTDSGVAGGTWSSSNPSIATVDAAGNVSGLSPGYDTIFYSVSGACGTGTSSTIINVSNTTDAGIIYGSSSVTIGTSTTLINYGVAGTWISSDPAIASIDPSGVVTGIAAGSVTISYAVTGCGGTAYATTPFVVNALNGISGNILFGGAPYYGPVTVYLITYNPATLDLEASDSIIVTSTGASAYYQFSSLATDSFRVKAAVGDDTSYVPTGYVPTYHTSSCYWGGASVDYHVAGNNDLNVDINMAYGSTPTGPGFIGGNVTMGAGRGTSVDVPAVGLLIFAVNSATGTLIQQTYTDGSGNYSFSNLPLGTYFIYPEAINYGTTAYTSITLTSAAPAMTTASFKQHTTPPYTITPIGESVSNVAPAVSSVVAFPNPVSGSLNIMWNQQATEKGTVSIADVTGREVYQTSLDMTGGNGIRVIDLSALVNGVYMITITSEHVNYNSKIQVQH